MQRTLFDEYNDTVRGQLAEVNRRLATGESTIDAVNALHVLVSIRDHMLGGFSGVRGSEGAGDDATPATLPDPFQMVNGHMANVGSESASLLRTWILFEQLAKSTLSDGDMDVGSAIGAHADIILGRAVRAPGYIGLTFIKS